MNINIEKSLVFKRANLVKKWIVKQGIECDLKILKSVPGKMHEALLKFADQGNSDLIMILTHEEFILTNNYLGEVLQKKSSTGRQNQSLALSHAQSPCLMLFGTPINMGKTNRIEHLNISENDIKN